MWWLYFICLVLVIIGALNWGLWGLFQYDLVGAALDGRTGPSSRVVYTIVGLAGLALAILLAVYYGVMVDAFRVGP